MKNKTFNTRKSIKLAATAFMSAVVLTVSTIPAFAHDLPSTVENDNFSINAIDMMSLDFSDSDILIIDENGMIHDGEIDPQIIPCNHDYYAVQISDHDKNSDGSCITVYYKGKRCNKCGHIVMQDKIGTATYKVCPH